MLQKKRVAAAALSLAMLLGTVPSYALAAPTAEETVLEFEDVAQAGGANVMNDANASGGKMAGNTQDKEFIFENVPAANTLTLRYACGRTAGSKDRIVVSTKVSEETGWQVMGVVPFQPSGSWSMDANDPAEMTVSGLDIPEGASVKLVPGDSVNLDCMTLSTQDIEIDTSRRREAERADCGSNQSWAVNSNSNASGGAVAGSTGNKVFIFRNLPASNKIAMKYAAPHSGSVYVDVLIDGVWQSAGTITFATTQSWDMNSGNEVFSDGVYIPEGSSVKITPAQDVDMDYFEFLSEPLNQEKDLPKGMVLAKNGSGGTAVEDLMSKVGTAVRLEQGDQVTFTVPELSDLNTYTLCYRAEQAAQVQIQVGQQQAQTLDLSATRPNYYSTKGVMDVSGLEPGTVVTMTLMDDVTLFADYMEFRSAPAAQPALEVSTDVAQGDRSVISLDGVWSCTSTQAVSDPETAPIPVVFDNTIPVPGLWTSASMDMGSYAASSLWYQKSIVLPDDFDPAAGLTISLEILRAEYGRSVYVNGTYVDSYPYNFTNSTMDITPYLHGGKNDIVVMLGNINDQKRDPNGVAHTGTDIERSQYEPGFTDSVNLVLNRQPAVTSVQTAADLDQGSVQVRVKLANGSQQDTNTDVTIHLYELGIVTDGVPAQRKLVGSYTQQDVSVAADGTAQVDIAAIALEDFNLSKAWEPENPYLYEIEVQTSGDTLSRRFGMRTFYFDPDTNEPMLNGKIHRLLGTNVALGRFYEDPNRGEYPWDREWVKTLYQEFQDTNWEVFRTHNCPLPQFWYDLADEMGLMIIDEYAIWYCNDAHKCSTETMLPEYKAMVDEKQTHPSIIYWDAQNETTGVPATGESAKIILEEGYDISNRHWDNGWDLPVDEHQPVEFHPYPFWDVGKNLDVLNDLDDQSPFNAGYNTNNKTNPKIVNEYASLWVNREGEATSISKDNYDYLLPKDATNEDRRDFYTRSVAYSTEFWRAGRNIAGIQQFTGLSYSKPGTQGATSDVLMPDISTPQVWDCIQERLEDSFNRLGIAIKLYDTTTGPEKTYSFPVSLFNDTNEDVKDLPVTLTVTAGGRVLHSETKVYSVSQATARDENGYSPDTMVQNFEVTMPEYGISDGTQVVVTASYTRNGETVSSIREMTWEQTRNVALNKPVTASSEAVKDNAQDPEKDKWFASYVNDGDTTQKRWACDRFNDGQSPWITIDLEKSYDMGKVEIKWENAYATEYLVQLSDDGEHFTDLAHVTGNKNKDNVLEAKDFLPDAATTSGRYIRVQCVKAYQPQWGFSIYEISVYDRGSVENVPVTGVELEQTDLSLNPGDQAALTAVVTPADASNQGVTWSSDNEDVATVDETGVVTAVSSGTAVITVTTQDGALTDTCIVTVAPKETADKSLLEYAYDYALKQDTSNLIPTVAAKFEAAMESAKTVLDNPNATQAEVDAAFDQLVEAIHMLGFTRGDKTMLELLITRADGMVANADKYVETHWPELVDALANAKDVAADGDAMEEDIQPVAQALLDAILAQRFKADKSILDNLVNQAESINLEGYTAESVATFRSALAEAQAVLADETLSEDDQKTVDAAVEQLTQAMDGLTAEGEAQPSDQPETTDQPEASQKPEATQQPENNVPQTGDTASLLPWAAALALSGTAALWVLRRKERN